MHCWHRSRFEFNKFTSSAERFTMITLGIIGVYVCTVCVGLISVHEMYDPTKLNWHKNESKTKNSNMFVSDAHALAHKHADNFLWHARSEQILSFIRHDTARMNRALGYRVVDANWVESALKLNVASYAMNKLRDRILSFSGLFVKCVGKLFGEKQR